MREGYRNKDIAYTLGIDRRRISELRRGVTFRKLNRDGVPQRPYRKINSEIADKVKSLLLFTGQNKAIASVSGASVDVVNQIRRGRTWR